MPSGVYEIVNLVNGKRYIGQSKNLKKRQQGHFRSLRIGKHKNLKLQHAFDLHGEEAFEFRVLCYCDGSEELSKWECHWAKQYDSNALYNIMEVTEEPNRTFTYSEATRQAISNSRIGKYYGENNPNFGNKWDHDKKLATSVSFAKLTVEEVKVIAERLRTGEAHESIAKDYGISRTVITRISNGTRWTNVTGGPIIAVIKENGKRVFSETHRNRIGTARRGKKHSEESRLKMSRTRTERYGKKGQ